ncbi:hypothetical protein [Pseudonocardia sp. GCM10023141]|uniref:hypothetical protein n=1 Tax=Pseudonocardia sp. GCM10023141 TaxID=3252653 RepID=UPI00360C1F02
MTSEVVSPEQEHIRRLIDGLRRDRRTHPQHGRREYSQRARAVAAACNALIATEPAAVPALTRRAVDRITTALGHLDDSNGSIGADLHAMMAVHARACTAAPPDPTRLARWLADLRLDGPGWPDFYLRDFASALGAAGRAELTRIIDTRARDADPDSFTALFGIRILREQLAELTGDVDHYVSVLAEDLGSTAQYRTIVDTLRNAGRTTDAETWARRGLDSRGTPTDVSSLRDTYEDLLLTRGAIDDALAFRHNDFQAHPTHARYRALRTTATRNGTWTQLRPNAISHLHTSATATRHFVDQLIAVLLDEDEPDRAWQVALDHADTLAPSRWQELIQLRQHTHPADVIEPWHQRIEQQLAANTDRYRYRKAATMITGLRDAYQACDEQAGYQHYITDLRHRHRHKTAFLTTLDRADL